ncbi:MAG TPA: hypothetical protein DCM87_16680 [Planctomycetes bacterium]|nr:hypothetical protein [Planctomycetota bacterium]
MRFGKLEIDPSENPAVIDSATWDRARAWAQVRKAGAALAVVRDAAVAGGSLPEVRGIRPCPGSLVRRGSAVVLAADLPGGQAVLLEIGRAGAREALGAPIGSLRPARGPTVTAFPLDAAVLDAFCRRMQPPNRPRALGGVPRLGIGTRMTTAVWPGIFAAADRRGFAANTIQNSVRELNLLDDLLACRPAPLNYACGFGTIETGYTGSTWEGLWTAGVLAAMRHPRRLRFGADADHVQVKRGPEGLRRAKRVLEAARFYTFFTLDLADVLDYAALGETSPAGAEERLRRTMRGSRERREVIAWHRRPRRIGGRTYRLDSAKICRFAAKYRAALDAAGELAAFAAGLKGGERFDLELSIDEHPPEIGAFDCLSSDEEILFVLEEIRRRGLPVTHIAPNFGQEKGYDYRGADGPRGLERRIRSAFAIAEEFGVLLDIHSADDLEAPARRAIRRATGGRVHYKISPMLQIIFARVLEERCPALYRRWWEDALSYARREARAGSPLAAECVKAFEANGRRSPDAPVFHHFGFAFVGRRDARGRFLCRDEFYDLPPDFYRAYRDRIARYLCGLADDLFRPSQE